MSLVLESDGTLLDSDEELLFVKDQPIVLLQKDQHWISEDSVSSLNFSTATTETVGSICSGADMGLDTDTIEDVSKMPLVIVDHNSEIYWQQFDIWSNVSPKIISDLEKGKTFRHF